MDGIMRSDHFARIRRLTAAHLPGLATAPVTPLGGGLDNTAYEVGGEVVFRLADGGAASRVVEESRLLAAVAEISPVPVPVPLLTSESDGCLAYRKLPGSPLMGVPFAERGPLAQAAAPALGRFLTALHRVPVPVVASFVEVDDTPFDVDLQEAQAVYPDVAEAIPPSYRPRVEAFLSAPPPTDPSARVLCHNDLGAEHLLTSDGALTGVIDWTDAALTTPARDLSRLYRDLGPAPFATFLAHYDPAPPPQATVFLARCAALEDLAYGLAHPPYLRQALAALPHLFPDA
ncbi:hypothetical protein GCM10022221_25950 [Actinocorallia aurea]